MTAVFYLSVSWSNKNVSSMESPKKCTYCILERCRLLTFLLLESSCLVYATQCGFLMELLEKSCKEKVLLEIFTLADVRLSQVVLTDTHQ